MVQKTFCCVGSVIGLAMSAAAAGQTAAPNGPDDDGNQLATVMVTAQKRSENLQDVPLTVDAISGDSLKRANINSLKDLGVVVPGLRLNNVVGDLTPRLRGVGTTAGGPGIENPIALYVDGVYYASQASSFIDFIGVENVQVLKGPQGTLFGRNATGGLISVTTRTPAHDFRMDADLGIGNYTTGSGDFYLTGGISSTLAADFAVRLTAAGDGYGTNHYNGADVYRNNFSLIARSKWLWTPTDTTTLLLSFDYADQKNSNSGIRVVPGANNLAFLGFEPAPPARAWDQNSDVQPEFRSKSGGIALKADQELDWAVLRNIVAYRQSVADIQFDLDATPDPNEGAFLHAPESQVSEELQLTSMPNQKVSWVAGLYYFHSDSEYDPSHITFDPNPLLGPPFGSLSVYGDTKADSGAAYGQATVPLLPHTNLTVGLRYTYETHSLEGNQPLYLRDGSLLANEVFPRASVSFDAPSYRLALDHHLTDELMVYASWSTGIKSGGYNTQALADPPYQPEKLADYEAGLKADLFNRRLRLDLAGFHYTYRDIQVQHVEGAANGIINGAAATLNGADLDFSVQVLPGFSISGSAEYLDAAFHAFPNAPLSNPVLAITEPVATGSAAGNDLPYTPRYSFTVSGNYAWQLPMGTANLNLTVNRTAAFYTEPDNVIRQSAYTMLDSFVEWVPSQSRFSFRLWGKNLTNEVVLNGASTLEDGLHVTGFEPPRTYGANLSYHFE